ncbi:MAG: class I SAM-dependent methyltransferase [Eubacteriales bacterium]|nr:class I SAM-dependent methyltransferase [Eubacteriales bacterium]
MNRTDSIASPHESQIFERLMEMAKKPKLYSRSTEQFWTDEYISKCMLETHLNPNTDAASRRPQTISDSVEWLGELIPSGASVLDIGCGPGLYCKPLSQKDYVVTGMDFSKRSIEYARSVDSCTNYICKNYLEMDFCEQFDAVIMIYCDYAALTADERKQLATRVLNALKPDGLFIFDVFTPKKYENMGQSSSWQAYPNGGFWRPDAHLHFNATYLYEDGTVRADRDIVLSKDGVVEYLTWDTTYTKASLMRQIESFGFETVRLFDDVCGKSYSGEGETLCMVANKPKGDIC